MANATGETNAQYYATFSNWSPNTGTTLPVPKLNITNANNLPNYNVQPVQVHQHTTNRNVGF